MRVNVLQLGDMEYERDVFVPQAEGGDGRKRQWGAGLPKNVPIFEVKCPQNRANSAHEFRHGNALPDGETGELRSQDFGEIGVGICDRFRILRRPVGRGLRGRLLLRHRPGTLLGGYLVGYLLDGILHLGNGFADFPQKVKKSHNRVF